jgi:hypothetical protein
MKLLLFPLVTMVIASAWCAPTSAVSTPSKDATVCGKYHWMVPGSTTDLDLKVSGEYVMAVVANSAGPSTDGYRETGTWTWVGVALVLYPTSDPVSPSFDRCRRLFPLLVGTNKELLVSPPGDVSIDGRTRFDVLFIKEPNQSADSTASAGTSAAGQPRVPASSASHL